MLSGSKIYSNFLCICYIFVYQFGEGPIRILLILSADALYTPSSGMLDVTLREYACSCIKFLIPNLCGVYSRSMHYRFSRRLYWVLPCGNLPSLMVLWWKNLPSTTRSQLSFHSGTDLPTCFTSSRTCTNT